MNGISKMLAVARGQEPADLVLTGGRIVNVFSGQIESADVAISGGRIAGIGSGYRGGEQIDLQGSFLAPGLIDSHVHIESSLCVPAQFAQAVVPHGVTTVIADPHEIANVAGPAGVRFMFDASRDLPLDVILMAPSCVPATDMATAGGTISASDLDTLRREGIVHGLAEVMNFPAVISGDVPMHEKISAMNGRPVDGHCPGVSGKELCAYIAAGVGSDHESVTVAEAAEKLARGLYLLIREATNARNLDALLGVVTPANSRRVCFCTDDRTPSHLLADGSVDEMLRRAIARGIDPIEAIRMCTLNPAEWLGLCDRGAIAPGRRADLIIFDNLKNPQARRVVSCGRLVAQAGVSLSPPSSVPAPSLGSCRVDFSRLNLQIDAKSDRVRVIGSRPDQLVTDHRIVPAHRLNGHAVASAANDLLKIAVVSRHGTTSAAVGFIHGFGLTAGAIAGTVAHDHHNLVMIGVDDDSMLTAGRAAVADGGGLAVAAGNNVLARLALPVGGLMSDRPVGDVAADYERLIGSAKQLGSRLIDPFMAMSFMGLEVIPSLKLTDKGLVDVDRFNIVDLFVM
ncbi:MAG TPA: adenine deaminase [Tepidisphaeraceae bacterium]|nr:adenine deaminase [Tepidisphaeraceae bacterium]